MSQIQDTLPEEAQAVVDLAAAYKQLTEQIAKVIVGQDQVVEQLLMALFSRGHCLLVGVPGLAKTLDRKSTRLNSSHVRISYAVFCLKKKKKTYSIRSV